MEMAIAPDDHEEFPEETATRFLLSVGDYFHVPPSNAYRLENHSLHTEAKIVWTIIKVRGGRWALGVGLRLEVGVGGWYIKVRVGVGRWGGGFELRVEVGWGWNSIKVGVGRWGLGFGLRLEGYGWGIGTPSRSCIEACVDSRSWSSTVSWTTRTHRLSQT